MNAQKKIFSFLFGFNGRMTRKPFWIAYAINRVIYYSLVIFLFNTISDDSLMFDGESFRHSMSERIGLIAIPMVILVINGLSLVSRRFHDTGRSFFAYLGVCFIASVCRYIPFLGPFVALGIVVLIIVLLCLPTDVENDTYGPVPQREDVTESQQPADTLNAPEEYDYTHLNGIQLEPCDNEEWASL